MLIYRILADVTVVIHALMASFVVLGLFAILLGRIVGWQWIRNFWFRTIHLGLIATIVVFPLIGGLCPLTVLENWLRERAGGETYPGSFIAHWVHELLFVDVSARAIAVSYCVFGILVFLAFFWVPPAWPKKADGGIPKRSKEP